jgi:hypothetical protein
VSAAAEQQDEPCVILTQKQVAEWLQLRPRQLERLGVPCLNLGHKTKRYLRQDVLAWLNTQRRGRSHRRSASYVEGRHRDVAINAPIANPQREDPS